MIVGARQFSSIRDRGVVDCKERIKNKTCNFGYLVNNGHNRPWPKPFCLSHTRSKSKEKWREEEKRPFSEAIGGNSKTSLRDQKERADGRWALQEWRGLAWTWVGTWDGIQEGVGLH
jgi:hypothetical protein